MVIGACYTFWGSRFGVLGVWAQGLGFRDPFFHSLLATVKLTGLGLRWFFRAYLEG